MSERKREREKERKEQAKKTHEALARVPPRLLGHRLEVVRLAGRLVVRRLPQVGGAGGDIGRSGGRRGGVTGLSTKLLRKKQKAFMRQMI